MKGCMKNYFSISWEITQECNLSCVFCEIQKLRKKDPFRKMKYLNDKQIKKIGQALYKTIDKNIYIFWTGGEPFLEWKKMLRLSKYFKQNFNFLIGVTTNATLIHTDQYEDILNTFDIFMISIDGIGWIHDLLRGKDGTYNQAIKHLSNLSILKKDLGSSTRLIVACVLNALNILHFDRFLEVMIEKGADMIEFRPLQTDKNSIVYINYGLKSEHKEHIKNLKLLKDVYRDKFDLPPGYIERILRWIDNKDITPKRCWTGENYMFIDAYGNAYPCCSFFPKEIGGFIPYSKFEKILQERKLIEELNRIRVEFKPNSCSRCLDINNIRLSGGY